MDRTPSRPARGLAAVVLTCAALMLISSPARAHEGIASSTPPAGSTIDHPIADVTLEFPSALADVPQLTILDPDEHPLPSTTTELSPTTYEIEFESLTRHGTYIVQYIAAIASDGDLATGAISFDYGSTGSGIGAGAWIVLGVTSSLILAVGIWFSLRSRRRLGDAPAT
jgi:methionine-rich copper-binding protein CopC